MSDSYATPWIAACQSSLSFIISQSWLKFMSTELVMPSSSHSLSSPSPPALNLFQHEVSTPSQDSVSKDHSKFKKTEVNIFCKTCLCESLKVLFNTAGKTSKHCMMLYFPALCFFFLAIINFILQTIKIDGLDNFVLVCECISSHVP